MTRNHLRAVGENEGDDEALELPPDGPAAEKVAEALRRGLSPGDRAFDRFLPDEMWRVSRQYWTPLVVVLRVAEWLDRFGITTAVDIGSGVGKFCVATALASRCTFTGLEQRPRLVQAARHLAQHFRVDDRVRFIQGALQENSIPQAEAYYLFNPFGENLFGPHDHLDDEVELSLERYRRDIACVQAFLLRAPVGTTVIKYNGFGGRMPPGYEEVLVDRTMPNLLRMWRKRRSGRRGMGNPRRAGPSVGIESLGSAAR